MSWKVCVKDLQAWMQENTAKAQATPTWTAAEHAIQKAGLK